MTTKTRREQELEREVKTLRALLANIGRPGQGESEERYRALFEQAYDAILMVNEADEIVDANRRACELFGYSRQQLLAMRVPDLQAPQVRGTAGSVVRNELARHGTASFETVDVRSDGTLILVEVSTTRITRPEGDLYIAIVRDITGLKRAERALREMADNMAAAQRIAHFGSWEISLTRELEFVDPQFWSDECYRIFGLEPGSVEITRELFYSGVHPDDREPAQQALIKALQERTVTTYEYRIVRPGGAIRYLQDQVQVLVDECTGRPAKLIGTVQDVTERKQAEAARAELETQLRQAHKLESIGRLAGGVAHDFNNLLTVIQGHAGLLLAGRPAGDPLFDDLEQIRLAAERAASLTRQLLTFSRRQVLAPAIIDLNSLVADLDKLLRRLIGEDISLATVLRPGLRPILADPGHIEQVIMNLVVNARDAMPTGGRLTIETSNIYLDDSYTATHPEAFNGPGVLLAVTDTGCGMDEATMAQIFEPFFTTKEPGKGTGLGLATVYGIVKQSRGDITVSSQPGRGASFKLYFPASQPAAGLPAPEPQPVARRGSETILLVEDEEMVRSLVGRVLQAEGYRLLEVRRGEEALALLEQYQGAINLLLTDVVMPGISGRELAERLKTLRPQAKVLFMSGYADDAVVRHGVSMAEVEFLAKPFSLDQLVARVRQVLDK